MAELTAQLNERPPIKVIFFNATTGQPRIDLIVNVQPVDIDGTPIGVPILALIEGDCYTIVPAVSELDAAGVYGYKFVPTVITNVAPVMRYVGVRVGQVWIERVDVPISSRMATFAYTAPDNAAIANILAAVTSIQTIATTIQNRIGAFLGTGVNTILGFLQSMMRSDASLPSDVGGTYNPVTDSLEAQANAIGGDPLNNPVPGSYAPGTAGYQLGRLGSGVVTLLTFLDLITGELQIVRGDDYTIETGTRPSWSIEGFPLFTSMVFKMKSIYEAEVLWELNMVLTGIAGDQMATVSYGRALTALLKTGGDVYTYDLEGTLAGGQEITPLVKQRVHVLADIR